MNGLIDHFGHPFGVASMDTAWTVGSHGGVVAALASAFSAALRALTVASTSRPSPCRFASQPGSLYDSHVLPDASCQTNAFNGRSIPIVWVACMSGVPPLALPKIRS